MASATMPEGTITWTLTREHPPGMQSTWWTARADCRHGTSEHQLVASRLETIRGQLDGLGLIHQMHVRCDCSLVELVIQDD